MDNNNFVEDHEPDYKIQFMLQRANRPRTGLQKKYLIYENENDDL